MNAMRIDVQLTNQPIPEKIQSLEFGGTAGAWVEFRGVVRGEENAIGIGALEYEAYSEMALRVMRRLLEDLSRQHDCLGVHVIHRVGVIPVGEVAIYVGIAGRHRAEAFALLAAFMDHLKQDVPIWKTGTVSVAAEAGRITPCAPIPGSQGTAHSILPSMDEVRAAIESQCRPLPPIRVSLAEAGGRILREKVCAPEDLPSADKSTRDGYAVLADDSSGEFTVVDTLHAADWKPRQIRPSEAVRVATGASLPCQGLRVVMQEDVERIGDCIRIVEPDDSANVRRQGEDARAGEVLISAGTVLHGGALALLATAGCVEPSVSPRLRVVHFTTGDEIAPPGQRLEPGKIRDSNSYLIRGLLEKAGCDVQHRHLPEDFEAASAAIAKSGLSLEAADVLLVSGGASVGDKDFTRPLLESLGYQISSSQVDLRPGKPLLFGVRGNKVAFGLPGNPLSHLVCFHAFVAVALARLRGAEVSTFRMAKLVEPLLNARCARETLWPGRLDWRPGGAMLRPQAWSSSGDVTCLAVTNALLRVPANCQQFAVGTLMEFLPTE